MSEFQYRGFAIRCPSDLKKLELEELPDVCLELRKYIAGIPTDKPAHLESSLGVTELTVALHYLLNTPKDALIWDVGHQTAVHKVLTGRGNQMYLSLRSLNGISGFPLPEESEHDLFQTGHSSTSISMALGLWLADKNRRIIAVIGDGALTGGQAYEALNIAGAMCANILVIFNDNHFSIEPNVGALSVHSRYEEFFKALNFHYSGPIDGNDVVRLLTALKEELDLKGPRVLHIKTKPQRLPSPQKTTSILPIRNLLRQVLGEAFEKNENLYLLSPAMLSGGGFLQLRDKFPDRVLDTGITEQACVSMAAGLSKGGKKTIVHLYSTFLQRAYDQIIHDVALQKLPVLFLIDRVGLVGEDGPTHHGLFDVSALCSLPDFEIYQPADLEDIRTSLQNWLQSPHLAALRFPRDSSLISGEQIPEEQFDYSSTCILANGFIAHMAYDAFQKLIGLGYTLDFRILKRKSQVFDPSFLKSLMQYDTLFLVEEAYLSGSFSQMVIAEFFLHTEREKIPKIIPIVLKPGFITHGHPDELLFLTGLHSDQIVKKILSNLDYK
ncbi:1-deoxy-D-xylulose-5-phosphate synthase N-terminal domain-containing protein [Schleiferia thermophila]|jgi:1-deoxy-D-xylulose-5-phosphate synthase|uniref:1-deoxy-D-xylulose-5-phosphate synthase N-terminal domain-containing protein n=1 Tax=Schleiferia thermophila TaxID=884107 RepID=UPI0004E7AED2|nr:1-deoxy-D-xylulose-5-phosphate synthase N-terminal domain-containing protein [Schleiferia thermophila]KFD38192.1 1-deoxy-D-xylulose-5-phosphate synthase [Schleiferia thermophila str. Yellowstone]